MRTGEVRGKAHGLARGFGRFLRMMLGDREHAQVHVQIRVGRHELAGFFEVAPRFLEVPAVHLRETCVHPRATVVRTGLDGRFPKPKLVRPFPRTMMADRRSAGTEEQRRTGKYFAAIRTRESRRTVEQPHGQHRKPERRRDVRPVIVDHFGRRRERRLGGKRDEKPERGERDLREAARVAQRQRDPRGQQEQSPPCPELGETERVREIVIDGQAVRDREDPHVVQQRRPLADTPDPRRHPRLVQRIVRPCRKHFDAVDEVHGVEREERRDRRNKLFPVAEPCAKRRVPRRIPVEKIVGDEHSRQRQRDRFGQERKNLKEHCGEQPPVQDREERAEVERRAQQRRSRPHVVQRLVVDRREREEERCRCRRQTRTALRSSSRSGPPQMVTDEEVHHGRGKEMHDQVKRVIAPRIVSGDRVVQRECRHEHRAHVDVLAHRRQRERIGKKLRNVREISDRGILADAVAVVEIEPDAEPVRVGDREADCERDDK